MKIQDSDGLLYLYTRNYKDMSGKLFMVPTPIGNLEDMSFRAIRILNEADLILAEDTRTSGKLLKHFEISTPMQSFHMHNEHKVLDRYIQKLEAGETIALISDAGTPCISDPGFLLSRECVRKQIDLECLPGATAFVPALVKSGFPSDKFIFEGFLPPKKGRQTKMKEIAEETRTVILYESPHKIAKTIGQFSEFLEETRLLAICREISKLYEECLRGTPAELISILENKKIKGEIVLLIAPKSFQFDA